MQSLDRKRASSSGESPPKLSDPLSTRLKSDARQGFSFGELNPKESLAFVTFLFLLAMSCALVELCGPALFYSTSKSAFSSVVAGSRLAVKWLVLLGVALLSIDTYVQNKLRTLEWSAFDSEDESEKNFNYRAPAAFLFGIIFVLYGPLVCFICILISAAAFIKGYFIGFERM
jgi:hypothetical protein